MSNITVDFAQYTTDTTLNGSYDAADTITLADTSTLLDGLSTGDIAGLTTNNVDILSATDGSLTWDEAQFAAFATGAVTIDTDTTAVLADAGANIALLTATQIGNLAAQGLAAIEPTDSLLTFSVGQFDALGAINVDASATFTIADAGATLAALSVGEIASLASLGVDFLHATDNAWSISIAQYQSLGTVALTPADTVTLADTGAHLNALAPSDYSGLSAAGIDVVSATTGSFSLTLADFNALGSVTLDHANTITLADTGATLGGLTTGQIDSLGTGGIDVLKATDGALSLSVAQYNETVTDNIALTPANTVTLSDTGASLGALTTSQINALVNVDVINATDGSLSLSVATFQAITTDNIALTASNTVTISDTAAHLAQLEPTFAALAGQNVDQLDATTAYTALTVADLTALGTVTFTGASSVTLTDTGANIAGVADFSSFAAHGIDKLDASDDTLTISEAQFQGLGTTTLTGGDTVTISDTAANIVGGPNYGTLAAAGVDFLNATTAINVTVNDITNLGAVVFTAGSSVTLADTGAHIAAVANFTTFGAHGVDKIDASNNTLTMNAIQYGELGVVQLTAADTVTISDTAVHLAALTFSTLAAANVDFLNATNAYTSLTVQNVTDLGAVHFTAASNVTLTDSAAHIQGASDFTTFATHGVDTIKSSDNALSLSVSQFSGLGTTHLTGSDAVTLSDASANLTTYLDTAGTQAALSTNGVDTIHATGGSLSIDAAGFSAVHGAGAVFLAGDAVTLSDTGAHIAALDFSTLATTGIDTIDSSDDALSISLAQYQDVAGTVSFTAGDAVTVSDTAAAFEALSTAAIGSFGTNLVDALSVTSGGDLDWSVAQWQALPGGVSISDTGFSLVVDDSETTLEGLTGAQFGAFAAQGVQEIASTEGTLNLSVSQAEGFLGTSLAIASGDAATLADTGANIGAMTATQFGQLAAAGFDTVDASDDVLALSAAQFSALGTVHLTGADAVTLTDTAGNLETYLDTTGANAALSANGIDTIHATGGSLSVDAAAAGAVDGSGAVFASGDTVTLADTGANIAAVDFGNLASLHVDSIDASDNTLSISLDQYNDIAGVVALTAADNVTVTGNLDDLLPTDIAAFATNHVDHLLDADGFNEVIWTVAQWDALGSLTVDNSAHIPTLNFVFDSAANLSAVTATEVANFVAGGAETWEESPAGDDALVTWTVANTQAMGGSSFSDGTHVTVLDSAANLEGVADFSIFAAHHIDQIDSTDNTLSLSVSQFSGLGATTLTGADAVTLADTASNLSIYLDGSAANGALSANGVDTIHATGNSLSVDAAAVSHVNGTGAVFASGDAVTLADTGANIAGLDFSALAPLHVDSIDASDNTLSISLDQYNDIAGAVALTAADNVTVTGNLDELSTTDIAAFATNHVDHLLDNDGFNEVIWTVAQWDSLGTLVSVDNVQHIGGLNFVFDSAANLSAVTATEVANFVAGGAETWEESPAGDDALVTWTVAKTQAMGGSSFSDGTHVTVLDSAANLEAVTDFSIFAAHKIDEIDSTDNTLTLTAAQLSALGGTVLRTSDAVTLADAATALQTYLDASGTGTALSTNGIDTIHATDGSLSIDAAALNAVASSSAVFTSGDMVTLADTGANIANVDFTKLASLHVDAIDATNDTLSIGLGQYNDIAGTVALTAGDDVTVTGNIDNLSTTEIASFATNNVDHLLGTDLGNLILWTVAQWNAVGAGVSVDNANHAAQSNEVFDSEANLNAVTATQIASFVAAGAERWEVDPSGTGTVTWDLTKLAAMGSSFFASAFTRFVISDTAANLEAVSDFSGYRAHGVAEISASDTDLSLTVAQLTSLGVVSVDLANIFTLADTAANLQTFFGTFTGSSLTSTLDEAGVDFIHATGGSLTVNFDEFSAISASSTVFTAADHVTLTGTQAQLFDNESASALTALGTQFNVDEISVTGGTGHLTVGQWNGLVAGSVSIDSANTIALMDTAATLGGENAAAIAAMAGQIDSWAVSDSNTLVLGLTQLGALATATIALTQSDTVELSGTETSIEGLNAAALKVYADQGVDIVHASDTSILNLDTAQTAAVVDNGAAFVSGDTVTLVDTGANIAVLTATQIQELAAANVDAIDASNDALTLSVAQFSALGSVSLTAGDAVTISDTSTNIAGLSFSTLAGLGVDTLHSTDGTFTLTVANFSALGAVTFDSANTVTISDTAANVTGLNFATLAGKDIDVLDVTTAFSLNVVRYQSMGGVIFSPASSITLSDTGVHLNALTAVQIGALAGNGIDSIDATNDVLTLSVAQFDALGAVTLTTADTVTLADTSANLATLNFATLASKGIDVLDATDNVLSLTVAQYTALGAVQLAAGDTVTLADTGGHIAALTATQIGALAGNGIDKIDATNNVLALSVAQFGALGTVTLTGADTVTLLDTGANLQTLSFSSLASKGIDILDASDNVLTLTAAQFNSLGTVSLKSSDTVTLVDTGADISALTVGQFNALAAKGIDILDASDNAYTLTVAKVNGLGNLSLAANDTVTVQDTEAAIEGETQAQIQNMVNRGVDIIHANNAIDAMSAAQITPLLGSTTAFAAGDTVTLSDTSTAIQALTAVQFGELAAAGVDKINATDNTLTLSVAQYTALGSVALAVGDTNAISDSAAGIDALTTSQIAGLSAQHVSAIQSSDSVLWSKAQWDALPGGIAVTAAQHVELLDTAANLESLTASEINSFAAAGLNVVADSGGAELDFTAAQAAALLAHTIDVSNESFAVVLSDTGSAIDGLSAVQLGELQAAGFTAIQSTAGDVTISVADFNALGTVTVSVPAGSNVVLSDTEAHIEALTNPQLAAMVSGNVDVISSQGGSLNVSTAQVGALLATGTHFDFANTVTLTDFGFTIAALGSAQIGALAAAGVDVIDTTNNSLTLSVAQYEALGTVALSAGDTNSISDSDSDLVSMSTSVIAGLAAQHISSIASTENFAWSKAQWDALPAGITLSAAQPPGVELFDTPTNIVSLTASEINAFATAGLTEILAEVTGELDFNMSQTGAILAHGIGLFNGNGIIAVTDTGANLAALTVGQIGQLHGLGFTAINASDDAAGFNKAQIDAFAAGSIALTQADTVTMNASEANIEGLSATALASYIAQGVDVFHSNGSILSLNESQVAAVIDGGAQFKDSDAVTLADTATNLQQLTVTEYGKLAARGVDIIDITSGTLSLSVADYQALGAFTIAGGAAILADTGADIATLTAAQLGALTGTSIAHIDATDNALSLSAAQVTAILHQTGSGTVSFDGTDTITLSDLGANIGALSTADLAALAANGAAHVVLDASDNLLTLSSAQYDAIVSGGIALTPADFITLADTGANLASLTTGQIAALSGIVDAVHATDNAVSFSIAQLNALHAANVALTAADTVTLADTESNIEALTAGQIAGFAARLVDLLHATGGTLNMNESQVAALVNSQAAFAAGDTVTLSDTGAHIAALTNAQFALLAARGVDHIDASDDVLALSVAQYKGLGSTTLTGSDTVTLSDNGVRISGLTVTQFGQLAANGIDHIDAKDNVLSLSVGQFEGLGAVTLTQTDAVTLTDTGAALAGLTATQIGALAAAGIDQIDSSNNALALSVAQFQALGSVKLTTADTVTLADSGAALEALTATQIGALHAAGVDALNATDNVLALSVAQYQALHQVTLAVGDAVTLHDTGAHLASLSAGGIGALAAHNIDAIDASDNAITFSLAQYNALGTVQLAANDVVTVNGTAGTDLIQGQAGSQILNGGAGDDVLFGGAGRDTLDGGAGNDTLNGGAGVDTVTYADATAGVTINLATGTATGGAGTDLLSGIENIIGSSFNDTIVGGNGANKLTGGLGADTFVYQAVADSTTSHPDTILDFSHAQGDKIDVSEIASFTFVDHLTHHADQLAIVSAGAGVYKVVADVNGDGVADLTIIVHSSTALVGGDFIL